MRIMSIIGIVWFGISLICVVGFSINAKGAAVGWGMLGLLYAIPYSIVGLIQSSTKRQTEKSTTQRLIELAELKEKGILSEDEFQAMKIDLLKM